MRIEDTMKLIEEYQKHPVQGTIIAIAGIAIIVILIHYDKKKTKK